jgi:8-oxo-dGTP pyrophosphatase MutT (NUDIX family)
MNINIIHKIGHRIIRKIQSLLGLITLGPRAIILNDEHQILLVKHSYQAHWYLPGGGLKKGESAQEALIRELKEEVGIIPLVPPRLFGIYYHTYLGVHDYPIIFIIKRFDMINASSPEIEESGWFAYDSLPEMISPGSKRRLDEFFTETIPSDRW